MIFNRELVSIFLVSPSTFKNRLKNENTYKTIELSFYLKKKVTNTDVCTRQLWRVKTERGISKLGRKEQKTAMQETSKEHATFILDDG